MIPVSEYLNTTSWPDRDYLDGQLKGCATWANSPTPHLQGILGAIFYEPP